MKKEMNNAQATINFLFFLHNHRDLVGTIHRAFGVNSTLSKHFENKLKGGMPKDIISFIMDMTDDNKEIFINQINIDYSHKRD